MQRRDQEVSRTHIGHQCKTAPVTIRYKTHLQEHPVQSGSITHHSGRCHIRHHEQPPRTTPYPGWPRLRHHPLYRHLPARHISACYTASRHHNGQPSHCRHHRHRERHLHPLSHILLTGEIIVLELLRFTCYTSAFYKKHLYFSKHNIYISETPIDIIRDLMNHIDWNSRLSSIKGPKGVGKSTLMRQYIKLNYPLSIYFSNHTILDLAGDFVKIGGERLFIGQKNAET